MNSKEINNKEKAEVDKTSIYEKLEEALEKNKIMQEDQNTSPLSPMRDANGEYKISGKGGSSNLTSPEATVDEKSRLVKEHPLKVKQISFGSKEEPNIVHQDVE